MLPTHRKPSDLLEGHLVSENCKQPLEWSERVLGEVEGSRSMGAHRGHPPHCPSHKLAQMAEGERDLSLAACEAGLS